MTTLPPKPSWFRIVYTWLGSRTFFAWPSWVTELLSGVVFLLLTVVIQHYLSTRVALFVIATVGSLLYEWKLDPNGWSDKDVMQREVGIIVAFFALWGLGKV